MRQVPSPNQVTAAYRARLLMQRAGLMVLIRALFQALYNPDRPIGSLRQVGAIAGQAITQAQAAAIVTAQGYLQGVTAASWGQPLTAVSPYEAPAGMVGSSASGHPLAGMAALAPAMWQRATDAGRSEREAQESAVGWLNRLGASEPYRVANATVLDAARNDDRLTGRFIRVTQPGACKWCILIHDRGYTEAAVGFAAHANCRCTPGPEVVEWMGGRRLGTGLPERFGGIAAARDEAFWSSGDWGRDLEAIKARNTSGWFGDRDLESQRAYQNEIVRMGSTMETEAQKRYQRYLAELGPRPTPDTWPQLTIDQRMAYRAALREWDRQASVWLANARLSVLADIRSMGGVLNVGRSRSQMVQYLRYAQQFYPTDWVNGMNAAGSGGPWKVSKVSRGNFNQWQRSINISRWGSDQDARNTAIHEMGHGMQYSNKQLQNAEWVYHLSRTTLPNGQREPVVGVSGPRLPREKGRTDKYPLAYSGREYVDDYLEVLTTTAESTFGTAGYADYSMIYWLLGSMAKL